MAWIQYLTPPSYRSQRGGRIAAGGSYRSGGIDRAHTSGSPLCQSVIFIEFSRKHRESRRASQRASRSRFEIFLMKSSEFRLKKRDSNCIECLFRCWWRRSCGGRNSMGSGFWVNRSRHLHLHFHVSNSTNSNADLNYSQA